MGLLTLDVHLELDTESPEAMMLLAIKHRLGLSDVDAIKYALHHHQLKHNRAKGTLPRKADQMRKVRAIQQWQAVHAAYGKLATCPHIFAVTVWDYGPDNKTVEVTVKFPWVNPNDWTTWRVDTDKVHDAKGVAIYFAAQSLGLNVEDKYATEPIRCVQVN